MLLHYGFTEANTPYFVQSLQLTAGLSQEDPLHAEKMQMLEDSKLSLDMFFTEEPGGMDAALATARILTAESAEELDILRRDVNFGSLRNECDALGEIWLSGGSSFSSLTLSFSRSSPGAAGIDH